MQAWTCLRLFIWIRTLLAVWMCGGFSSGCGEPSYQACTELQSVCGRGLWGACFARTMMIFYLASDHLLWFGSALVAAGWCCADCHLGHDDDDDDDDDFLFHIRVGYAVGVTLISGSTDFRISALHPSSHSLLPMLLLNPVTSSDLCPSFTYSDLLSFGRGEERISGKVVYVQWIEFVCRRSYPATGVPQFTWPPNLGEHIFLSECTELHHSCALHGRGWKWGGWQQLLVDIKVPVWGNSWIDSCTHELRIWRGFLALRLGCKGSGGNVNHIVYAAEVEGWGFKAARVILSGLVSGWFPLLCNDILGQILQL